MLLYLNGREGSLTKPPFSPKIQRLVTPRRLQRRRHLNSLKKRRLVAQKEQKVEFEYVLLSHVRLPRRLTCIVRTLLAKRVAEKKEKIAAHKAAHTQAKKCAASLLSTYFLELTPTSFKAHGCVSFLRLASIVVVCCHCDMVLSACPSFPLQFFPICMSSMLPYRNLTEAIGIAEAL